MSLQTVNSSIFLEQYDFTFFGGPPIEKTNSGIISALLAKNETFSHNQFSSVSKPISDPSDIIFWYYLHWGMIWVLGAREQRRIFACGSSSHQGFGARFFLQTRQTNFGASCWCMIWTWNKKKETWISSSSSSIKSEMCHPKSAFPFSEKLLVAHSRELL